MLAMAARLSRSISRERFMNTRRTAVSSCHAGSINDSIIGIVEKWQSDRQA
jgi:hypothetical protein